MAENVFVLGLDDGNAELLRRLPGARDHHIHGLLGIDEVRIGRSDFRRCLARACERLDSFDGPIDAVTGYWDFPVTSLVPILCERYGLPSSSLESIVKCEHKYWSRLEQAQVTDAYPRFGLVDPHADPPRPPEGLTFPLWLKPVKSSSSKLAYRVTDDREFTEAIRHIRAGIGEVGGPFDAVLERVSPPPEVANAGATACLAEEAVGGAQITVEGYRHHHEPHVYGVVDSVRYPGTSSFLRYRYPSTLPEESVRLVTDIAKAVVVRMGLRSTTFDIEFFVEPGSGRAWVLEVNPRLSQSHARLFEAVDGVSNLHCMVSLALGKEPTMPRGQGPAAVAAKCFLRRFTDGIVQRVPSGEEIAAVEREVGVIVDLTTRRGNRLADQYARDSYSYELADIHIAAGSESELIDKYERCVSALRFEIGDI
ncbi:ATP-grasp domain-containing protein [Saccharomonospora xinjiangensis]|uniref:ATP-grasp enzyme, D-alanine-D-alanine ligase n=1 Tax=Saccharomonospora xinjiangensis XJ-54 TaxID=882086 RepID=I0UX23_9PSEU|nr:ATP-grasp domain-containing protein [Saccharomonospora xinjiangensis]EID52426.1 ATP-grasp enzyme, D-alanine-D-alanine ligase [Saccharomonospora xinjiangensis XJ-54]